MHPIDVARARQQTPGCGHVLHFNNAGASLMPETVYQAVADYQRTELYRGGYEAAAAAAAALDRFYASAARLLGARPDEIAFMENATRAWEMAFLSLSYEPGDKVLVSKAEYASNYIALLQKARRCGLVIEVVDNDATGQIDLEDLRRRIDGRTKLISLTHIPTQGGLVNPAEAVGRIAREAGVFYLLDATQSVGQMPLDVEAIGCDALCATGRKYLRGPRGTGFLYVSRRVVAGLEPPLLDLHGATWTARDSYVIAEGARRFETWEVSSANKLGLTAAIDYALDWGVEAIWERVTLLASRLRRQLSSLPGVSVCDQGTVQCGIVTCASDKMAPAQLSLLLRERSINTSVSYEEYARLDLEERRLPSLLRASVHYYNSEEEVDRFCQAVADISAAVAG